MAQQHLNNNRFNVLADIPTDVRTELTKVEANFDDIYTNIGSGGFIVEGATASVTTAKLTTSGTEGALVFSGGILVSSTAAT